MAVGLDWKAAYNYAYSFGGHRRMLGVSPFYFLFVADISFLGSVLGSGVLQLLPLRSSFYFILFIVSFTRIGSLSDFEIRVLRFGKGGRVICSSSFRDVKWPF